VLSIFNCMPQHFIHTMYCYKTFHYKRYTKYKYILFITSLPYRITPKHLITLTVKCPNMENETVCKFRSNIRDISVFDTMRICFKTTYIRIKLSRWAVCTQIGSVIQRYLRKLRNKSSVRIVQIEKNFSLNIEPFPLGVTEVLSGPCNCSYLV